MIVLRTFLALLAGFLTIAALIAVLTALLHKLIPSWADIISHPKPGINSRPRGASLSAPIFVSIGGSFLAAAAGGYVTASLARGNPLKYVLVLAVIVVLLEAVSTVERRRQYPIGYILALVTLTPLGVLAGGLIRLRVLGVL